MNMNLTVERGACYRLRRKKGNAEFEIYQVDQVNHGYYYNSRV